MTHHIEALDFQEQGYKLRIGRLKYSSRADRWGAVTEDGVVFSNPTEAEPTFGEPAAAAIRTAFPDEPRHSATNVAVGELRVEDLHPLHTFYVLRDGMFYARDESGNYGIGGSFVEALYNTRLLQAMDG